jgi:3-isopropylmalate/(R)-2-methylmalate dehydratase small subunit
MLKGRVFKFGDNISTDLIIPGRLLHLRSNLPELAKHVLEDADPTFAGKVKKGDFVVGGSVRAVNTLRLSSAWPA